MASLVVESVDYSSFIDNFQITDFFQGNLGRLVDVDIIVRFENYVKPKTGSPVTFEPSDLIDPTGYIRDDNGGGRFADFYVGDNIEVSSPSGTKNGSYVITEKISNSLIRVGSLPVGEEVYTEGLVNNTTPITGIKYFTNTIPNSAGGFYENLFNSELQSFTNVQPINHTNPAPTFLLYDGVKSWQVSQPINNAFEFRPTGVTIIGLNDPDFQKFQIKQTLILAPLHIEGNNGVDAPYYFDGAECLKHAFKIDLKPFPNNPNRVYSVEKSNTLGNTGFVGEILNGGTQRATLNSLVITRLGDGAILNKIELIENQDYQIDFTINAGGYFGSGFKSELKFFARPQLAAEISDNTNFYDENHCFDVISFTEGAGIAVGLKSSGSERVLSSVELLSNTGSSARFRAILNLGTKTYNRIKNRQSKEFSLLMEVKSASSTVGNSDAQNVEILVDSFKYQFENDLVQSSVKLLDERTADLNEPREADVFFPENRIVCLNDFTFDRVSNELINSITTSVVLEKTGESFVLDSFEFDLSNAQIINDTSGGFQDVDFSTQKNIQLSDADIRRTVSLRRYTDIDDGFKKGYRMVWPFVMNWQYWIEKQGVNSEFFDQNEPENGLNEDWFRYFEALGWEMYVDVKYEINNDGFLYENTFRRQIQMIDYTQNPNWVLETIETLDVDTLQHFPASNIWKDKDTRVRASATTTNGINPDLKDVYFVVRLHVKEKGGVESQHSFSNRMGSNIPGYLKTLDYQLYGDTLKVVKNGNTFVAECLIDHTKLPQGENEYTISAHIK